jgi:putative spermidine/putrescine transport system ATP-binding protein
VSGPADSIETQAAHVSVVDIHHEYQRDAPAVRGISLSVESGEFLTLLGPSGSGKTTLLRIIAGLLQPTSGRVYLDGRDVTRTAPGKRDVGLVFQNYALFPHLSVFQNVAFPLRLRKIPADEIRRRVAQALELVLLTGFESRLPAHLSGGQQQRVALARAIVFEPTVLLMDEPLGSLDKRLRQQLQLELRRLQREVGITTIYVTHDQEEAFSMSDRIAVLNDGLTSQVGTPEDIYRAPVDEFVAHFVGEVNYFRCFVARTDADRAVLQSEHGTDIVVKWNGTRPAEDRMGCAIRPEKIRIGRQVDSVNSFSGGLQTVIFQGSHYRGEVRLQSGESLHVVLPPTSDLREGDEVEVGWEVEDAHLFRLAPSRASEEGNSRVPEGQQDLTEEQRQGREE